MNKSYMSELINTLLMVDIDSYKSTSRLDKPMNKCLLPDCNNRTSHNGGYCCSEHCKEHNKKQKETK